jgi:glutamyl/glutaminyl-tRNA synthetase
LSKRHDATAVSQYREDGFLPEALQNYLVLLGWTSPSGEEVLPLKRVVEEFSLSSLSKNAPVHSIKKLEWLNSIYLRGKDDDQLSELLLPHLVKAGVPIHHIDSDRLKQISDVLKENLVVLSQVQEYLGIFFDDKFSFNDEAKTVLSDPKNQETLRNATEVIASSPEITREGWPSLASHLEEKTGRKGKALFSPLRAGTTGKMKGPELAKTFPLLGKERILRRLKMALALT